MPWGWIVVVGYPVSLIVIDEVTKVLTDGFKFGSCAP